MNSNLTAEELNMLEAVLSTHKLTSKEIAAACVQEALPDRFQYLDLGGNLEDVKHCPEAVHVQFFKESNKEYAFDLFIGFTLRPKK